MHSYWGAREKPTVWILTPPHPAAARLTGWLDRGRSTLAAHSRVSHMYLSRVDMYPDRTRIQRRTDRPEEKKKPVHIRPPTHEGKAGQGRVEYIGGAPSEQGLAKGGNGEEGKERKERRKKKKGEKREKEKKKKEKKRKKLRPQPGRTSASSSAGLGM